MRASTRLAFAVALITGLTTSGGLAQDPPAAAAPEEVLDMAAEQLEVDVEGKTAVLSGNVKLTKGSLSVSCPRVDVRYDDIPHVTWVKGSGGVVANVKGVRAEAPEVELDLARQRLDLRGGVRLSRGGGWITADKASINIATAKVTMTDVKGSIPVSKPSR
jgi:lipopolysaccharide transport protein LptA